MISAGWLSLGLILAFQTGRPPEDGRIAAATFDPSPQTRLALRLPKVHEDRFFGEDPLVNAAFKDWLPSQKSSSKGLARTMILLKNERGLLPLENATLNLVVVGLNAIELAGALESQKPSWKISKWELPSDGSGAEETIPSTAFPQGLSHESYDSKGFSGIPETDQVAMIDASMTPDVGTGPRTERWTGVFLPPEDGEFKIGIESSDSVRLILDGDILLDQTKEKSRSTQLVSVSLVKGSFHVISVETSRRRTVKGPRLVWVTPSSQPFPGLKDLLKDADVVVLSFDGLPNHRTSAAQSALFDFVQRSQKPVVALVNESNPISDGRLAAESKSILAYWGSAAELAQPLAQILTGLEEPGGRLPVTIWKLPEEWQDNPNYQTSYLRPLFPFGSGFGFTAFSYEKGYVSDTFDPSTPLPCRVTVKNLGPRDGDDVIQIYARYKIRKSTDERVALVGFRRIHLRRLSSDRFEIFVDFSKLGPLRPDQIELFIGNHQPLENAAGLIRLVTRSRKPSQRNGLSHLAR